MTLAAGSTAIVVTVVATNIDTAGVDPNLAVANAAQAATADSIAALESGHVQWWKSYWSKSSVSMPTQPAVERYWYMSQYTAGSSLRFNGAGLSGVPKTAPGINSIWLIGGEHNGYTMDYNACLLYTSPSPRDS